MLAGCEPVAPIRPGKPSLVEVIFEIESNAALGSQRGAQGDLILKADPRALGYDAWGLDRQRTRVAAITKGSIDKPGPSSARPLEIGNDLLADALGEIGPEAGLVTFAVQQQLRAEPVAAVDAAFRQEP